MNNDGKDLFRAEEVFFDFYVLSVFKFDSGGSNG